MIVRAWRGRAATNEDADAYARHLKETVFPQLARIAGHRGAQLLRRDLPSRVEFLVLTSWESMEAVRAFAGTEPELAVVEPAARAVLSDFDESVDHYEVVIELGPGDGSGGFR